jgi:hypothetical protein
MFTPFEGLAGLVDHTRLATDVPPGLAEPPPQAFLAPSTAGQPHTIKRMDPIAGEPPYFFLGIVREKLKGTASIGQLYAAMGDVGRKTNGLPAQTRAIQITVVDTQGEPNESYTGVIDAERLEPGVTIGVLVGVTFKACVTPSAAAWLISEIIPI